MPSLTIGDAAKASGVTAKMIRYYEEIGLIEPPARSEAGYRHYHERDIHNLRFVRRARDLGFSVEQIAELLALWRDRERQSAQVKSVVESHLGDLKRKISELQSMVRVLESLSSCCHGDDRPDCPILDDLEAAPPGPAPHHPPRFGA